MRLSVPARDLRSELRARDAGDARFTSRACDSAAATASSWAAATSGSRRSRDCSPATARSPSIAPDAIAPSCASSPPRARSPGSGASSSRPTSRASSSRSPRPARPRSTSPSTRRPSGGRCWSTSSTCPRCATSSSRRSSAGPAGDRDLHRRRLAGAGEADQARDRAEFGEPYARLAVILNDARGWAKATLPTYQDRKEFFEGIVNGEPDPVELVRAGRERDGAAPDRRRAKRHAPTRPPAATRRGLMPPIAIYRDLLRSHVRALDRRLHQPLLRDAQVPPVRSAGGARALEVPRVRVPIRQLGGRG